ncbi:helix-turn-helix transcriptional regulator [Brevibacillus sp. NPDC003359]|uniref:helix-turn-helix transcriptional regulator n=1 Tax=unclassified Brevibacillus TaxID=2684853 RepID=UPI0036CB7ACF
MTTKDKFITFEKVGMTYKDFFHLFIFRELSTEAQHAALLYKKVLEVFPTRTHSRAHFYQTISEMSDKYQWIKAEKSGRKLILQLTNLGKEKQKDYFNSHFERLHTTYNMADHFIEVMEGNIKSINDSFPTQDQRFFSKLVRVRDLVRYFILNSMVTSRRHVYGSEVLQMLINKFGWQCSEGYFYELIHEMEGFMWIEGKWDDPTFRRKKLYHLLPLGEESYEGVKEKAFENVKMIKTFVKDILVVFEVNDELQKLRILQTRGK